MGWKSQGNLLEYNPQQKRWKIEAEGKQNKTQLRWSVQKIQYLTKRIHRKREGENGKVGIIKEIIRISLSRLKGTHLEPNPMNENKPAWRHILWNFRTVGMKKSYKLPEKRTRSLGEDQKSEQHQTFNTGTSLVAQWLRIRLPMQGTQVRALVPEDPTCHGAARPVYHNYWACVLQPTSHNYWAHVPQLKPVRLEPCSATREATAMRSPRTTTKSSPHSPQLENAGA